MRKLLRRLFWLTPDERWWPDPIFTALSAGFGFVLLWRGAWITAVVLALSLFLVRELLYHFFVRRKQ